MIKSRKSIWYIFEGKVDPNMRGKTIPSPNKTSQLMFVIYVGLHACECACVCACVRSCAFAILNSANHLTIRFDSTPTLPQLPFQTGAIAYLLRTAHGELV